MTFSEVMEAIHQLSLDEQKALLDIVRRRMSEARRSRLIEAVREARREYSKGEFRVVTPSELARDISE